MEINKKWKIKGTWYECCRTEGQCPLWFGRELWDHPCKAFSTFQIKEGKIGDVDVSGITIIYQMDGVGPKFTDLAKGPQEGAIYISDNATNEQREVLDPFVKTHMGAQRWRKLLGVKYVPIEISENEGTYHVSMPYGEQKISLSLGGDGKNPILLENHKFAGFGKVRICNTQNWNYCDYGKTMEYRSTSGQVTDFDMQGED